MTVRLEKYNPDTSAFEPHDDTQTDAEGNFSFADLDGDVMDYQVIVEGSED